MDAMCARARNEDTNESNGVVFAEVVKDGTVLPELVTGKGMKGSNTELNAYWEQIE